MSETPLDCVIAVDTLTQWIDTLDTIVSEARIHVDADGWRALPVDPANVAMVEQTLDDSAFEAYYAEELTLGLNLETFHDYVTGGDSDLVAMEFDQETRKMHIQCGRASFDMALIDPDSIRNDGDIENGVRDGFVADIELDGAALAHGVDIAGMVSDHLVIEADPDSEDPVRIGAEGDTDGASVEYSESLHEGSTVDSEGASVFSHDYLDKLTKEIPNDAAVSVGFGDEWPLMLEYEHANGAAEVTALCAPRIKSR